MLKKTLTVAALVAFGSVAYAEDDSASYDLDPTLLSQSVEFSALKSMAGSFMDTFSFTFTSAPPSSAGAATAVNFSFVGTPNVDFTGVWLNGVEGTVENYNTGLSFFVVGPVDGDISNAPAYLLKVAGTASAGATYGGSLNVALVPEPETYAMLLAGLGVLGFVARRRASQML